MNLREKYTLEIEYIMQDIELIKRGKVYEIDRVPGNPKCSTVGDRLEKRFNALIAKIEQGASGSIEAVSGGCWE